MAPMKTIHSLSWSASNVPLPMGMTIVVAAGAAPLVGWALAREQWLILALLVVVAAVPILIRWPVVSAFGLYAFLVPFDFLAVVPGGATFTKLAGLLAAAVLVSVGLIERRLGRPPKAALWVALFWLWAIMSAAWAINPALVFGGLPTVLGLFLLYFVAVSFRVSERELVWVCALTVLGGAVAAGWSSIYGVEEVYDSTARGTLAIGEQGTNPNLFAATLLLPLTLATGGFLGARGWFNKLLSVAAVAVVSFGIYLTMSRGALVGLAAVVLVLLYRFGVRWQILLIVTVLVGAAIVMPQTFFERIEAVYSGEDSTGAARTKIWEIGIDALRKHGVIGAGFRSFTEVFSQAAAVAPRQFAKGSHNTYLGTWVELGIVGLGLLLVALAHHLLAVRKVDGGNALALAAGRATEAACYGVLVSAFFLDALLWKFFWLSWILLIWSVHVQRKQA